MSVIRDSASPTWPPERWGFPGDAERSLRDLSHMSLIVFALAAVAAGILAGVGLSSEFGIGGSSSFIVAAILFPLLCGGLAKEVWRVKRLEDQIRGRETTLGFVGSVLEYGDNTPAGLLIVSPDLRIQFANQKYLETTLQETDEVLGWKIQDLFTGDGLEDKANTLLSNPDPAASCCMKALIRIGLTGERQVHITMTRIAPRQGEARILVVVEEMLPDCSIQTSQPAEGYVC